MNAPNIANGVMMSVKRNGKLKRVDLDSNARNGREKDLFASNLMFSSVKKPEMGLMQGNAVKNYNVR